MIRPADRPPVPAPVHCATRNLEADWVWDADPPIPSDPVQRQAQPGYEIDSEWWGQAFHCSRICYITGAEYKASAARSPRSSTA